MLNLVITQWREAFDDDDSLDVRMVAGEDFNIRTAICEDYEIEVEDPESEDLEKNPFVFINEVVVVDGEEFTDETGKKWRVRFEEVSGSATKCACGALLTEEVGDTCFECKAEVESIEEIRKIGATKS